MFSFRKKESSRAPKRLSALSSEMCASPKCFMVQIDLTTLSCIQIKNI